MAQLTKKIKAFTLLEALMAMLIIMIVFGLTTYVFVNVSAAGFTPQKKKAYMLVQKIRCNSLKNQLYVDEYLEEAHLSLQQSIEDYQESERLKVLHIVAHFNKQLLYESKDLILID